MFKRNTITLISLLILALLSIQTALAATPRITELAANTDQVAQYQRFELTFQIDRTFPVDSFLPYYYYDPTDPVGVNGITIDARFRSPLGRELVVPAFYYQDYTRTQESGRVVMTPQDFYAWKVRFAPAEAGVYTYHLTIQDKEGVTRYPESGDLSLTVQPSASPGFIRVSPRDSRFMEFDNGQSFIPISSGRQWWSSALRSLEFDQAFADFGAHGINFTRVWSQNDGYGLTVEGPYDAYTPQDIRPEDMGVNIDDIPKGTQINQRGSYEVDMIMEAAERHGVYIMLSSHGDAYWIWTHSIYDESWNRNRVDFNDPLHLNYWKRNFRYRVARWGYSTSLMGWETWNEHGHVPPNTGEFDFYQNYSIYQRQTDPYNHLLTTSQGSQTWSPAFWSSPAFDIATYHDYMRINYYDDTLAGDTTNFVYRFTQCLRTPTGRDCGLGLGDTTTWNGPPKPIIWGEFDFEDATWTGNITPQPRATHNAIWSGLFSSIGMVPVEWFWQRQSPEFIQRKYDEALIASQFFQDVDYAGLNFQYASTQDVSLTHEVIQASHPDMRVLLMRAANGQQAYAWVQHRQHTWLNAGNSPAPLSGTFTVPQMMDGSYRVEYWNTYTGEVTDGGLVSAVSGSITIAVNNLSNDMAIKVLPTSQQAPTNTPQPTTAVTATMPPTNTPTVEPTALPPETAALILELQSQPAALNDPASVAVQLVNVVDLFGLELECNVDPAVLNGTGYRTGEGFNETNSYIIDSGFAADTGSWVLAASRLQPNPAIEGSVTAITLDFVVVNYGSTDIQCKALGVDENGQSTPLEVINTTITIAPVSSLEPAVTATATHTPEPTVNIPTITPEPTFALPTATFEPTITPSPILTPTAETTQVVTAGPTTGTLGTITGVVQYQNSPDNAGITIRLMMGETIQSERVTESSGAFQFPDLPAGSYSLVITGYLALPITLNVDLNDILYDSGIIVLPQGDTDGNGSIDLLDAGLIGANFGGDASLVPAADLNRDSQINIRDLVLIGSNFGLSYTP